MLDPETRFVTATVTILQGDWIEQLRTLPDAFVHCVVTSPPYWGLRDYGVPSQLGLEKSPEEYIAKMVAGFHEVWRVLRKDGTLWLNLGSSYAASGKGGDGCRAALFGCLNFKPKDLIPIPWLVALALQADGWYLRSDIIWHKPNPLPESVTDRPTKAHEYIFLLTKSDRYFFDAEAVKEAVSGQAHRRSAKASEFPSSALRNDEFGRRRKPGVCPKSAEPGSGIKANDSFHAAVIGLVAKRNKRSVWTVSTAPFKGAHFATFPPKLVEPCILAGTSEKGCCPKCGSPWRRIVEKPAVPKADYTGKFADQDHRGKNLQKALIALRANGSDHDNPFPASQTVGWDPTCKCGEWTCAAHGIVLESEHEQHSASGGVQVVSQDIHPRMEDANVLQQGVLPPEADVFACSNAEMPDLWKGVLASRAEDAVLLQTVRSEIQCQNTQGHQGLCDKSQWIQVALHPESPNGIKAGLCDGAQDSDGKPPGQESRSNGGCSSQEREQVGQPIGKPAIRNKAGARPKAKGEVVRKVSSLRESVPHSSQCPRCHSSLVFRPFNPIPATVLDCFGGSGTVGQVALENGRSCVLVELNAKYIEMIRKRCSITPGLCLA